MGGKFPPSFLTWLIPFLDISREVGSSTNLSRPASLGPPALPVSDPGQSHCEWVGSDAGSAPSLAQGSGAAAHGQFAGLFVAFAVRSWWSATMSAWHSIH